MMWHSRWSIGQWVVLASVLFWFSPAHAQTDTPVLGGDDVPAPAPTDSQQPADLATPAPAQTPAPAASTTAAPADIIPAPDGEAEVVAERLPSGEVHIERQVIKDAQGNYIDHGEFAAYYRGSKKKYAGGQFVKGKRHGPWFRIVHPGYAGWGSLYSSSLYGEYDAPLRSEATFINGVLEGVWTVYDKHGAKVSEWSFKGGKPHGPWIWYYPNGQKRHEQAYIYGIQHGEEIEYTRAGKPTVVAKYDHGVRRAFETATYPHGGKHWEGWYHYGKEKVKTSFDWWKGDASSVVTGYEGNKVKHGKWTWWHPNGQKWAEGHYNQGKEAGHWSWWTPAGKLQSEKTFEVAVAAEQPAEPSGAQAVVASGGESNPVPAEPAASTKPADATGSTPLEEPAAPSSAPREVPTILAGENPAPATPAPSTPAPSVPAPSVPSPSSDTPAPVID